MLVWTQNLLVSKEGSSTKTDVGVCTLVGRKWQCHDFDFECVHLDEETTVLTHSRTSDTLRRQKKKTRRSLAAHDLHILRRESSRLVRRSRVD